MELYQMQYVIVLGEELNFSKAAERLCITQPAISRQIKQLEAEIGIQIFERDLKKVTVTPAGKEFISRVRKIYTEYENLKRWIDLNHSLDNTLSFGLSSYCKSAFVNAVENLPDIIPGTQVQIVLDSSPGLISKVKYGMLDFAFVDLPDKKAIRAGLRYFPVYNTFLSIAVSPDHPLAHEKNLSPDKLNGENFILGSSKTGIFYEVSEVFKKAGIKFTISEEPDFFKQVARIKKGEIALSKITSAAYAQQGLVIIPLQPNKITEFSLITSSERHLSDEDEIFIKKIRDSFAKP